jgi:hypothetical protein
MQSAGLCQNWQRTREPNFECFRTVDNWPQDACLIGARGGLGETFDPGLFYNVVLTPQPQPGAVPGLFALGQGPKSPAQATRYLEGLARFAQRRGLTRLLVVNVAASQVPDFRTAVADVGQALGLETHYVQSSAWDDGHFVPMQVALDLACSLADWVERSPQGALIAVNCNAGLDRSGIVNAPLCATRPAPPRRPCSRLTTR